jgi:hypothetical protein
MSAIRPVYITIELERLGEINRILADCTRTRKGRTVRKRKATG